MTFWGCALKPGQKQKVDLPEDEVLHLSQVCLHEPKAGKNYLSVHVSGANYTFCCLEKDKIEHSSLDLFFGPDPPTFHNKGTSEVHFSGYMEPKDEGEEGEEDEDEESEEEVGDAVAASKASPKASPKTSPAVKAVEAKTSPKVSPKASPKAAAAAAKDEDDDEDDDDEGEEEGEEEEMEEGEESEEPEASEEEEPASKKKAAAKEAPKRKAEEATPPAKKTKTEASPKAAATPSPKSEESQYVQQLVDFLKTNGKTKLSDLGSKVKRPSGVPKMKTVFDANKDKFVFNGDSVELKK